MSARARVSTTKRKITAAEGNGSFIQHINPVSTVNDFVNDSTGDTTIIQYLKRIEESYQALSRHIDNLENRSSHSTPVQRHPQMDGTINEFHRPVVDALLMLFKTRGSHIHWQEV